jgi:tRNA A37 methylthiotransferase MiaB
MKGPAVQFVRPPYKTDSICPPINLMALAGYIEPHYRVCITDFVLPYIRDELSLDAAGIRAAARLVLAQDTPVLAFTSMCSSYAAALRIAEECKLQDPSRHIVLGGPHASFVATETLQAFGFVDAIVIGEGEAPFLEVLDRLSAMQPLDDIAGVAFRSHGRIVETKPRPVADELDGLPLPAFHLIEDPGLYFESGEGRSIEIEVGRGCPFACTFCSTSLFFSRKYRMKSPARVVEEMRWLRKNWDIASFSLIHDNLTSNKKKVREFCEYILALGETFHWHCSSRTDTIDRPLMDLMRAAGCQSIFFGVETGSYEMQKIMGKRLKIDRVHETFRNLQAAGLQATASFIIGFPEETLEMLEQTLQAALQLRLDGIEDVQLHPLSALPGTDVLAEHEARLQFHPQLLSFHDITSVIEITETERRWIEANRRVFSNFYAIPPHHYPLELVYKIRGCYFYLIHFRPHTLQCIHHMTGLNHVAIVERLCARLPAVFDEWLPETLLEALTGIIAQFEDERALFEDVNAYEDAIASLSERTARQNGCSPADAAAASAEPRLRPVRLLRLRYDVPRILGEIGRRGLASLPAARPLTLAIVFEAETTRIRTFEVDVVTSHVVDRVRHGAGLMEVLDELPAIIPPCASSAGPVWKEELLQHLDAIGLLVGTRRAISSDVAASRSVNCVG